MYALGFLRPKEKYSYFIFFLFWAKVPKVFTMCTKKHTAHKMISVFFGISTFFPISNPLYKELGTPFPSTTTHYIVHRVLLYVAIHRRVRLSIWESISRGSGAHDPMSTILFSSSSMVRSM